MHALDDSLPPARGIGLLVAPHGWLGARGMAAASVLQALAGLALAATGIRFDGALDVHRTWQGGPTPWATAFLDQVAAWPIAVVAAWLVLRLWRYSVPLRLLAWTMGLARVALVLTAPLVLAIPTPAQLTATLPEVRLSPPTSIIVTGLAALVGVLWFVALQINGLRSLTNARGARLAGLTVTVLVAAEIASKLAVSFAA